MGWTKCYSIRLQSRCGIPAVLPLVALRELRERLETLTTSRCINGWAACRPLWEDETRTVVRLRFPDDQSAALFALTLGQIIDGKTCRV